MAEINNSINDSVSSCDDAKDANDHDEKSEFHEIYKYENKIFSDHALLLKSIESFFNEQITNHKSLIQKKPDEIDKLIASMENRISNLEDESIKINSLQANLNRMEEHIRSLQTKYSENLTSSESNLTTRLKNIANYDADTKVNIDCDVLFIGDSNLKMMKEEIMDKGSKCQKIICFTINEVSSLLEDINIVQSPKNIFIHVGTNDLERKSDEEVISQLTGSINQLRTLFNSATIYVSSILPRKDRSTENINQSLQEVVDVMAKTRFVPYQSISANMLGDVKHLNKQGFSLLLSTIRFVIFGKLPKSRPARQ